MKFFKVKYFKLNYEAYIKYMIFKYMSNTLRTVLWGKLLALCVYIILKRKKVSDLSSTHTISKKSAFHARDPGLIPGLGRSSGEGNVNLLQYSCLENPMERGTWQALVHGVTRVGHNLVVNHHTNLRKNGTSISAK